MASKARSFRTRGGPYRLVDVNSFCVSCERAFDPSLKGKPIVVLSNKTKALAIENGDPWFKLAPDAKRTGLIHLSSNYELYGNLVNRAMELLGGFSYEVAAYSIDEPFSASEARQRSY